MASVGVVEYSPLVNLLYSSCSVPGEYRQLAGSLYFNLATRCNVIVSTRKETICDVLTPTGWNIFL